MRTYTRDDFSYENGVVQTPHYSFETTMTAKDALRYRNIDELYELVMNAHAEWMKLNDFIQSVLETETDNTIEFTQDMKPLRYSYDSTAYPARYTRVWKLIPTYTSHIIKDRRMQNVASMEHTPFLQFNALTGLIMVDSPPRITAMFKDTGEAYKKVTTQTRYDYRTGQNREFANSTFMFKNSNTGEEFDLANYTSVDNGIHLFKRYMERYAEMFLTPYGIENSIRNVILMRFFERYSRTRHGNIPGSKRENYTQFQYQYDLTKFFSNPEKTPQEWYDEGEKALAFIVAVFKENLDPYVALICTSLHYNNDGSSIYDLKKRYQYELLSATDPVFNKKSELDKQAYAGSRSYSVDTNESTFVNWLPEIKFTLEDARNMDGLPYTYVNELTKI